MRFAFFSTLEAASWGGSELLWSECAAILRRQGNDVCVSVNGKMPAAPVVEALSRSGCTVYHRNDVRSQPRTSVRQRLSSVLSGQQNGPGAPYPESGDWDRVNAWLDGVNPEFVVISHSFFTDGYTIREACTHRGIPFAVIIQSADEHVWPEEGLLLPSAKQFEAAAACYFVSKNMISFARRVLATPLERAHLVYNPYKISSTREILPIPPTLASYKLACVARLECRQKGQDLLFEVLSSEKWRRRPMQVSLFGEGPNAESLRRLQSLLGVSSVAFRGFEPDVSKIWNEHHALILPSRYEGLPIALVEAMMCGRPCIVTDVMGNAELVLEGETGFIASAPSTIQIDSALERAWQSRDRWSSMGERAAAVIRSRVPECPAADLANRLVGCVKSR